jgi:hypothetical protein
MRFRYLLRLLVPVIALILILILSLILSILYRAAVIFTSAQDCQTYASATVRTLRTQEHTNQVQIHMALCSARDQTKSGGESIYFNLRVKFTCALVSQSQRNPRTYSPGFRCSGTRR